MRIDSIHYRTALTGLIAAGMLGCAAERASGLDTFGDEQARDSLETLNGCFLVRYQFVEDGPNDFFFDGNIEYMDVRWRNDEYLVRNYLILDEQNSFLHWTQTWTSLGEGVWHMRVEDGEGNLRYEAPGVWRFNQWESESAPAVKPNRDKERNDYDHLVRRNVIQFTPDRWVQSEINIKMREDHTPVASEVGWITYTKQADPTPCAPAMEMATADQALLAGN